VATSKANPTKWYSHAHVVYWHIVCSPTCVGKLTTLREAILEFVHDGDTVAAEGFSHLVPFAAGHEIIRLERRNLTLVRLSADLIADQMVGMGCVKRLIFSWAGNPGLGLLHRFRDAVENGWPIPLQIEEHNHAGLAAALVAGAARLPFGVLRGYVETDLVQYTATVTPITCPFTGEMLASRYRRQCAIVGHHRRSKGSCACRKESRCYGRRNLRPPGTCGQQHRASFLGDLRCGVCPRRRPSLLRPRILRPG